MKENLIKDFTKLVGTYNLKLIKNYTMKDNYYEIKQAYYEYCRRILLNKMKETLKYYSSYLNLPLNEMYEINIKVLMIYLLITSKSHDPIKTTHYENQVHRCHQGSHW